MKALFPINCVLILATIVSALIEGFIGAVTMLLLGALQLICALIILFLVKRYKPIIGKLLAVYFALVITTIAITIPLLENYFFDVLMFISGCIAFYFVIITWLLRTTRKPK